MNPSAPTADPGGTQPPDASTPDQSNAMPTGEPPTPRRVTVDDDRILGGVAGLIARRLGVDALWVRIAFVLLALAGGIGLVLYAGLWLVLTDDSTSWRWPRVVGGVVLVIGIPLLLNAETGGFVTGPVAVVLLLSGLALALWRPPGPLGPSAAGVAIDGRPPSLLASPVPSPSVSTMSAELDADRRQWRRPRLERRESSVLGRAALGLAIAVAAIGALIDEANGGRLHPEQWLGAGAVVCGLGLLVGTLRGHGRWLIVPAVVFAGGGYASGIGARLGIDASDAFGDHWVSIGQQEPGGLRTAHSAFGSVDVYVDGVPAEPVVVDARVGIGDIAIRVNDGVRVEVRSRVDEGAVELDGTERGDDEPVRLGPEGAPDVIVNAWVGRGDVNVHTYVLDVPPPAVPVFESTLPQLDAPLAPVSDGVAATSDGWFVLADGAAVIGADDAVVVGEQFVRADGVTVIPTTYGEFQLLPRSLLITPFGEILDLESIRTELAAETSGTTATTVEAVPDTTSVPSTGATAPTGSIGD